MAKFASFKFSAAKFGSSEDTWKGISDQIHDTPLPAIETSDFDETAKNTGAFVVEDKNETEYNVSAKQSTGFSDSSKNQTDWSE